MHRDATDTPISEGGPAIPDHQLLRCIGRGSYGAVWLARNLMGVHRAVKVVYRKTFEHQRPFERELAGIRKFEPVSRSHEGFVDILHVGNNEREGYFYYIMELGDDLNTGQAVEPDTYVPKTLAKDTALKSRLSLDESLQLGLSLTNALSHLHKQGLVHRDIKPSNIIFVNGVPKLADIGLVAHISEARSYVGTEGFIPPEGPGTPQADVYSLGKVLYEIATGLDRHDFPELPAFLDQLPDTDRFLELNEVIVHACKGDVSKRYQSAADMHADLVVLANGKSVTRLKLLEKRLANIKRVAGAVGVVLVLMAAVFYQVYREFSLAHEKRQRQVGAQVAFGLGAMEKGDLLEALPSLVEALRLDRSEREVTHRVRVRSVLDQSPKLVQMWFDTNQVNNARFTPDGQRVVIAQWFGKARVYDIASGEPRSPFFGQDQALGWAAFSPNGQLVVTASQDGTACIWNSTTGEQLRVLKSPDGILSAVFSPDGSRVVTSCIDGIARVWKWSTGEVEHTLVGHKNVVLYATFNCDGRFVATTSWDNTARVWDASTGLQVGPSLEHSKWITYAAFSPDSSKVVTAGLDNKASVWRISGGSKILPDLKHGDGVYSAEFSPDGLMIVTASFDGTVRLWDANTLQPLSLNPVVHHGSRVLHASFGSDGHRIVTTCRDGSTRVWDLSGSTVIPVSATGSVSQDGSRFLLTSNDTFQIVKTATTQAVQLPIDVPVQESKLNRDGHFLLTLTEAGEHSGLSTLTVWDVAKGTPVARSISFTNSLKQVSLSDNGRLLAVFADTNAWIAAVSKNGLSFTQPLAHEHAVSDVLFSPDARWIVTLSGNFVRAWDVLTQREAFPALLHELPVSFAVFSSDGRRLITGSRDSQLSEGSARIWNAVTGEPVGASLTHGDGLRWAAFSPDGRKVVTGSEDFTARVWDASSGKPVSPPLRHAGQVRWAAFSPDDRWVVTACSDGTARIWDADNGEPLTPPLPHPETLSFAAFGADAQWIITANTRGNIWLWDVQADLRPADDLILISQVLVGIQNRKDNQSGVQPMGERRSTWDRLRSMYPSDFVASNEEVREWHRRQADYSQKEKYWSSAVFHLQRLQEMQPDDTTLQTRLEQARQGTASAINR